MNNAGWDKKYQIAVTVEVNNFLWTRYGEFFGESPVVGITAYKIDNRYFLS